MAAMATAADASTIVLRRMPPATTVLSADTVSSDTALPPAITVSSDTAKPSDTTVPSATTTPSATTVPSASTVPSDNIVPSDTTVPSVSMVRSAATTGVLATAPTVCAPHFDADACADPAGREVSTDARLASRVASMSAYRQAPGLMPRSHAIS